MSQPKRYYVGDEVVLTEATLETVRNGNRSIKARPHSAYVDMLEEIMRTHPRGVVTHIFPPGYEVTVAFGAQSMHMKDNWIEPAPAPEPTAHLAELASRVEAALQEGKRPDDAILAQVVGAARRAVRLHVEETPTVMFTVEDGVGRVAAVRGSVSVVHVDLDREGDDPLAPEDVEATLRPELLSGTQEELDAAIDEARDVLKRYVEEPVPGPGT